VTKINIHAVAVPTGPTADQQASAQQTDGQHPSKDPSMIQMLYLWRQSRGKELAESMAAQTAEIQAAMAAEEAKRVGGMAAEEAKRVGGLDAEFKSRTDDEAKVASKKKKKKKKKEKKLKKEKILRVQDQHLSGKKKFEVEEILEAKRSGGGHSLFIKWVGFDSTFHSWEPLATIKRGAAGIVEEYIERNPSIFSSTTPNKVSGSKYSTPEQKPRAKKPKSVSGSRSSTPEQTPPKKKAKKSVVEVSDSSSSASSDSEQSDDSENSVTGSDWKSTRQQGCERDREKRENQKKRADAKEIHRRAQLTAYTDERQGQFDELLSSSGDSGKKLSKADYYSNWDKVDMAGMEKLTNRRSKTNKKDFQRRQNSTPP
jgi:hypothetical protein